MSTREADPRRSHSSRLKSKRSNARPGSGLFRGFFIFFAVARQVHNVAANSEGLFEGARGLEGYTGGSALPGGHGARRIGKSVIGFNGGDACAVEKLLENWLAAGDLGYHREDFFTVIGDAAVGGIVAVPTGGGVDDVEFGKIDGGNVGGGAVD